MRIGTFIALIKALFIVAIITGVMVFAHFAYAFDMQHYRLNKNPIWIYATNDEGDMTARMLYDHQVDPDENENISENPENQRLVAGLSKMLRNGWRGALPDTSAM